MLWALRLSLWLTGWSRRVTRRDQPVSQSESLRAHSIAVPDAPRGSERLHASIWRRNLTREVHPSRSRQVSFAALVGSKPAGRVICVRLGLIRPQPISLCLPRTLLRTHDCWESHARSGAENSSLQRAFSNPG